MPFTKKNQNKKITQYLIRRPTKNKTARLKIMKPFIVCLALMITGCVNAFSGEEGKIGNKKTLLDVFLSGGPLMWPLLLCSAGTVTISAYCVLQINNRKVMPKQQTEIVFQHLRAGDATSAYTACQGWTTLFATAISAALLKVNYERDRANKPSMEQAAEEALAAEETRLMLWVNYLNVFATIAPMLGLLGTVTGMIASFDQLALGKAEPADLAGGIGEAMITTAGGLIVGIPAMFAYFYFRNLLTVSLSRVQGQISFLIDVISGELRLEPAD